jgi:hypothetical protein
VGAHKYNILRRGEHHLLQRSVNFCEGGGPSAIQGQPILRKGGRVKDQMPERQRVYDTLI